MLKIMLLELFVESNLKYIAYNPISHTYHILRYHRKFTMIYKHKNIPNQYEIHNKTSKSLEHTQTSNQDSSVVLVGEFKDCKMSLINMREREREHSHLEMPKKKEEAFCITKSTLCIGKSIHLHCTIIPYELEHLHSKYNVNI